MPGVSCGIQAELSQHGAFLLKALVSDEEEDAQEAGSGQCRASGWKGRVLTRRGEASWRRVLTQPCCRRGGFYPCPFEDPVTSWPGPASSDLPEAARTPSLSPCNGTVGGRFLSLISSLYSREAAGDSATFFRFP